MFIEPRESGREADQKTCKIIKKINTKYLSYTQLPDRLYSTTTAERKKLKV
jgi:hypothetical protein